jgi:hypothetical protein
MYGMKFLKKQIDKKVSVLQNEVALLSNHRTTTNHLRQIKQAQIQAYEDVLSSIATMECLQRDLASI